MNLEYVRRKSFKRSNVFSSSTGSGAELGEKLLAIGMQVAFVDEDNPVVSIIDRDEIHKIFGDECDAFFDSLKSRLDKAGINETIYDWKVQIMDATGDKEINVVEEAELAEERIVIKYNSAITDKLINLEKDYEIVDLEAALR